MLSESILKFRFRILCTNFEWMENNNSIISPLSTHDNPELLDLNFAFGVVSRCT